MKKTILVIEDDYFVRTLLDFLLKETFEVVTKENGYNAMLWLDSGNIPDLILSDVDMPQINAFNLLNHLQKSGYYRNIPILILSGHSNPEVEKECMNSGASGYITKPFNPSDLLDSIQLLLNKNSVSTETDFKNA